MPISDKDKALLAWALDCALTERQKVGMLKYSNVMAAAKNALQDQTVQDRVCDIVQLLSPETADDIRDFLKKNPR